MLATHTLGEIADEGGGFIRTGPFGTQLHQSDYQDCGIPVVMPKDLIDGRVSDESIARIGDEDAERLAQHRLKQGDIVYGRRGDIGRRALITAREAGWLCGTGCLRISLGDTVVDPKYLNYYLSQPDVISWIANQAIGATMPNLNTSILRSVPVTYPDRKTQRQIAGILSAYDDLIENNTRRIRILEEMAQSLYREWFVHFRYPGHEHVPLVESSAGPIPEGWEVVPFTSIADVLSGGTPKTTVPEYWGGNIPFFAPRDAPDSFYVTTTSKQITEGGLTKCNSKRYPKDTVFVTARGTVGKVVLAAVPMAMNQSCYALRGREGINQTYLFMTTQASIDYLKQNTGGATFDTIVVDTFRRMQVVRPIYTLVRQFSDMVTPLLALTLNLTNQVTVLRSTRDSLMPKLMSP